jgi:hypothetical protein
MRTSSEARQSAAHRLLRLVSIAVQIEVTGTTTPGAPVA